MLESALKLHLVHQTEDGKTRDFFQNRIIIPIHNPTGHVIGFAGRSLSGKSAKYINSHESEIYVKTTVLYGLSQARKPIGEAGYAYLVEGYFDVMSFFENNTGSPTSAGF